MWTDDGLITGIHDIDCLPQPSNHLLTDRLPCFVPNLGDGDMLVTAFSTTFPVTGSFRVSTAFDPNNVTGALVAGGSMLTVTSTKASGSLLSGEIYPVIPQPALDK